MNLGKLLGLLLCNVLWSAAYAVSKDRMAIYSPMELSFLRYLAAALPLVIYCLVTRGRAPYQKKHTLLGAWLRDLRPLDARIVAVGVLTFFISPLCQMTGLKLSRAIDGSLMIAAEPLVTIIAACLMLGERLRRTHVGSLLLAISGVLILSDVTWAKLAEFTDLRLVGNSIFLISMLSEAMYSTISKPVLDRRAPALFLTIGICVGVACMFTYNIAVDGPARLSGLMPLWERGDWRDWAAVLYLGLGCTAFGYLFWMIVLVDTPLSVMALTLYVQPILGLIWGSLFLGESLSVSTFTGGALILTAVWLGSRPARRG